MKCIIRDGVIININEKVCFKKQYDFQKTKPKSGILLKTIAHSKGLNIFLNIINENIRGRIKVLKVFQKPLQTLIKSKRGNSSTPSKPFVIFPIKQKNIKVCQTDRLKSPPMFSTTCRNYPSVYSI